MASWIKWFKNEPLERPEPLPGVTLYTDAVVTVASTSANAVIRQFTNEFAREMNEKADSLDRAIEADKLSREEADRPTHDVVEEADRRTGDIMQEFRGESDRLSPESVEEPDDSRVTKGSNK
jgi:hypothetical protein